MVGYWKLSFDKDVKGFQVLPHRWIVERTFAWLGKYRRLSKDYEGLAQTSEAFIYIAMIHVMVRRIANQKAVAEKAAGKIVQMQREIPTQMYKKAA